MLIQYIHSKNYLHRDIKPENFVVGFGEKSCMIYAIDFGLSMLYRVPPRNNHISYSIGKSFAGTARYVSISAHLGCEQSRRDDLESILYVTLYFLAGKLPWQGMHADSKQDKYKKILETQRCTSIETLFSGFPSIQINPSR